MKPVDAGPCCKFTQRNRMRNQDKFVKVSLSQAQEHCFQDLIHGNPSCTFLENNQTVAHLSSSNSLINKLSSFWEEKAVSLLWHLAIYSPSKTLTVHSFSSFCLLSKAGVVHESAASDFHVSPQTRSGNRFSSSSTSLKTDNQESGLDKRLTRVI